MNLTYVPTYLTYGPRQADGWPEFVTAEGRAWAVEAVIRGWAEIQASITDRWMDLGMAEWAIFDRDEHRPHEFRRVALRDARLAVAHRALLAAGLKEVWVK